MPLVDEADIVLYYAPKSRAFRTLWFLEELGQPYRIEHIDLAKGDHKRPDYLKLNPMGKVPTLVDEGTPIAETGRHPDASRRQIFRRRPCAANQATRAAPIICAGCSSPPA